MTPAGEQLMQYLNEITGVDPMAYQERAMKHYAGQLTNFSTQLKFIKTGEQISKSIEGVVTKLITRSEEAKVSVQEICKRRELDPKEVIEAGTDETAVGTYSMKAETSMGKNTSNTLIRELQEDLTHLRRYGMVIESYKQDVENLQRIQKNIEPKREFDLSFDELTNFGF